MIKNKRQYLITKKQMKRLEESLSKLITLKDDTTHPILLQAEQDSIRAQVADFKNEIKEYEKLSSGMNRDIKINSLEELPQALIKARISKGFTHKDLARIMDLKEQQIQRYEEEEYSQANLQRIIDISHALGIKISEKVKLRIE